MMMPLFKCRPKPKVLTLDDLFDPTPGLIVIYESARNMERRFSQEMRLKTERDRVKELEERVKLREREIAARKRLRELEDTATSSS
jgi:hypothetical protein